MSDRPYLDAANLAGQWVCRRALEQQIGIAWPSDLQNPGHFATGIYEGTAGVILFLLELFHATRNEEMLRHANLGADWLLSALDIEMESGLYTGIGGMGFALNEVWKATNEECYRRGSRKVVCLLLERVDRERSEVERAEGERLRFASTDVISGMAGIGLFLLYAAQEIDSDTLELAVDTGLQLIERGDERNQGIDWPLTPILPFRMPNFSHGTAGVAYYLAALYCATGDRLFLDAAVKGARYLQSIAIKDGGISLIQQYDPPDRGIGGRRSPSYRLGWCHGPAGTAALWLQLYEATGSDEWLGWIDRAARTLLPQAIPESLEASVTRANGNAYCHGLPGDGDFLVGASRILGRKEYRDLGLEKFDELLSKAEVDGDGLTWKQSFNRQRREGLAENAILSQCGFSTGTSGVGMALLHADGCVQGRKAIIRFLDLPLAGSL